tara:strand:+ start:2409 stop:2585 length:177 start_codon:yes stop_codon:yes gene_type:complete
MDEKTKLIIALMQVDNLVKLTDDNHWKNYIYGHLNSVYVELERQLTLVINDEKNTEKN